MFFILTLYPQNGLGRSVLIAGAAGTWSTALERGLTVILVLVGLSLAVALADVFAERRRKR